MSIKNLFCCILLTLIITAPGVLSAPAISPFDEDVIIYTANQEFLSRVYIMRMDGSVITWFEYEFFRLCDLEVVNGEIYIAEAFAPRGEKFDPVSGDLDVIIDDWSLYYFYDIAFDGTYFYVTEWDLNRYDLDGVKDGTASFDYDVYGGAWDGQHYWTLTDEGLIRCWDVSGWPTVNQIHLNSFSPPSADCRGLWFDGEYFWTAESKESALGYIYKFDYDGTVIDQWLEPAYQGWGACVLKAEQPTVNGELTCEPISGTLPFASQFTAQLSNLTGENRRIAGRINVTLANGTPYFNWRAGWTNLSPAEVFTSSWNQGLPSLGSLVGSNVFTLVGQDVTPAPYNQPPYPASGDTDTATCTVEGIAP